MAKLTIEALVAAGLSKEDAVKVTALQAERKPKFRRMSFKASEEEIITMAMAFPQIIFQPAYRWHKKGTEGQAPARRSKKPSR